MHVDWFTYLGVIALAYLIPGPDFLVIMRWSTRRRGLGVAAALGAQSGLLCHLALATAGLSLIIAKYSAALVAIRIVGGLYLVFLGGRIVAGTLHSRGPDEVQPIQQDGGVRRAFVQGWLTNVTNPKAVLFFAAVLSQFVDPHSDVASWAQIAALGLVDIVAGAVPWALVIALGVGFGSVLNRRRVRAWWDRVTGTVLGGLGVGIIARG